MFQHGIVPIRLYTKQQRSKKTLYQNYICPVLPERITKMASSYTNVLITGTKSGGIGHGLLTLYASRPNTTIIAAIRNTPDSPEATAMVVSISNIGSNSNIVPVQYDASDPSSAHSMVQTLQSQHPKITHLDLVIANAAQNTHEGPVTSATPETLAAHFRTNATGPILLYQATRSLLLNAQATANPRFILISTVAASLERTPSLPFPIIAYGMSKAAANFFIVKANQEEERLALVAVHPGWVQSGKGNEVARKFGREKAPVTIEDCCAKLAGIFDRATKEEMGGTFQTVDGGVLPW